MSLYPCIYQHGKIKNTVVQLLLFTTLLGLSACQQTQAPYIIHFSHSVDHTTPKGKTARLFAQLVKKRLAGKVTVKIYPNSELYIDRDLIEAMIWSKHKTIGLMGAPSLSDFIHYAKPLQAFDLPYLFNDITDVHKLVDSPIIDKMTAPLAQHGIKALGFWDNGMKVFSIRGAKPLTKIPADFRGKTIRIQNSKVHYEMIKVMGGIPKIMPFKKVYKNLGLGVIDGQENAWSNIYSKKFYEQQDYITVSNHSYLGYAVVINAEFWHNLPADIRHELKTIIKEVTKANRRYAAKANKQDREAIAAIGSTKIITLSNTERKKWAHRVKQKVEAKFSSEIGKELLKEIHKTLDK
ncbi:MAG TPA: DctP family TRAP transporter solute-binding subunit [Thiothrix sp.]|nr:DctP family TRAP transporter solute-binding subunit [Thiothrix sp.]